MASQCILTKEDHPFQAAFFDGADEAFGIRIQIRGSWREFDGFDAVSRNDTEKLLSSTADHDGGSNTSCSKEIHLPHPSDFVRSPPSTGHRPNWICRRFPHVASIGP